LFVSAEINEAAKRSMIYIRNVPSKYWTLDVKNLIFCEITLNFIIDNLAATKAL
jgi:hypothetical protein